MFNRSIEMIRRIGNNFSHAPGNSETLKLELSQKETQNSTGTKTCPIWESLSISKDAAIGYKFILDIQSPRTMMSTSKPTTALTMSSLQGVTPKDAPSFLSVGDHLLVTVDVVDIRGDTQRVVIQALESDAADHFLVGRDQIQNQYFDPDTKNFQAKIGGVVVNFDPDSEHSVPFSFVSAVNPLLSIQRVIG